MASRATVSIKYITISPINQSLAHMNKYSIRMSVCEDISFIPYRTIFIRWPKKSKSPQCDVPK